MCVTIPSAFDLFSKEVWVLPWQVDRIDDVRSSTSSTSDVYSPSPSTGAFVSEQLNSEVCVCAVLILLCHYLGFDVSYGVCVCVCVCLFVCLFVCVCVCVCNVQFIGVSLSEPHSDSKSCTVVRAWKNDGKIQAAPHYCKFGTVLLTLHIWLYGGSCHKK